MKYKIYNVVDILHHLNINIENKEPFSLIRFGDGGLKMMNSYSNRNNKNIKIIESKEGLPKNKMGDIIKLWANYANKADYIDNPSVYDDLYFWGRYKKKITPINKGTKKLLLDWEKIYNKIGISTINRKYCNPEFNWLAILNLENNLIELMKNRKICFISIFDKIERLHKFDIDFIKVVAHYENQFDNSFADIMKYIEENATKYDLWLNSSGELGRLYSGRIKDLGGRVLDMGFVAQYWNDFSRPNRFEHFIEPDLYNSIQMKLTKNGMKYKKNI